jgi:hypothetical protein
MTLNVMEADYAKLSTCDVAGIRLVVLGQNRMPFPEDIGLIVGPRKYAAVGISKVKVEKRYKALIRYALYASEYRTRAKCGIRLRTTGALTTKVYLLTVPQGVRLQSTISSLVAETCKSEVPIGLTPGSEEKLICI